jgi:DNA processing protein
MDDDVLGFVTLHAYGLGHRAWREICALGVREAQAEPVRRALAPRARGREPTARQLAAVERLIERGGAVLGPAGAAELGRLVRAPHAPLCVYARGDVSLVHRAPSVAIVGTRRPSARGERRARGLAEEMAGRGICVVSGGAAGVDMVAHEGALAAGGETVVVLGDTLGWGGDERPARVRALCEGSGWLTLTPHGPWTRRSKGLWVSRNRLIAALADAVVIVEGRAGSGTRHTAKYARQMGVPVFAVPGDPDDPVAAVPNALLASGAARPFLGAADLGLFARSSSPAPAPVVDEVEAAVLAALDRAGGRLSLDALFEGSGRAPGEVLAAAARLELAGLVERVGALLERA